MGIRSLDIPHEREDKMHEIGRPVAPKMYLGLPLGAQFEAKIIQ